MTVLDEAQVPVIFLSNEPPPPPPSNAGYGNK